MELFIPILNKLLDINFYFIGIMNNRHRIMSVHSALPPKVWGDFFPKKAFHGGQTFLNKNILGRLFWMGGLMIKWCQGGEGVL